ncbi:hypothetical protein D3C80_1498850 [compost metagenome]
MHLLDGFHDAAEGRDADQLSVVRVDEGRALAALRQIDAQSNGLIRARRHAHAGDRSACSSLGRGHPTIGRDGGAARLDMGHRAIDGGVDAVLEQIEPPRQGHQAQEGQDQDPGVEMPAPDGAIGA